VEMVNATTGDGRFLGATLTQSKSNEIPAACLVLREQDLLGKIVIADALHTNFQTAQQILHEQGADDVLTVKGNQPEIQKTLASLFKPGFFPLDPRSGPKSSARSLIAAGPKSDLWICWR